MGDLNVKMCFAGLLCTLVITGVSGLLKPSYISSWHHVNISDSSTTDKDFYHGFGHLPQKVEVQVRSPAGFIYSGTVSTYNDGSHSVHAGVTVMYSPSAIRILASSMAGATGGQAYIVYTGLTSWTPDNQEYLTSADVRVRAWDVGDLPKPTFSQNLIYMRAGDNTTNYKEIHHASGVVPELTVVQYRYSDPSFPYYMEAQGTSSHVDTTGSQGWGGIVFAVDENYIRLWAPSSSASGVYGVYTICDGWGVGDYRVCRILEGELIVKVYQNLESVKIFSKTDTHSVSDSGVVPHDYTVPITFNVYEDLVIVESKAVGGYNSGYHFQAAMAATFDDAYSLAGLVYAYSSTGNVRVWHSTTSNSYTVRVGPDMGNVPAYEQYSNYVNITIKIWRGLNCPTLTSFSSNVSLVSRTVSRITLQCVPNMELSSGDLVRLCQIDDTWSGSPPHCASNVYVNVCPYPESGINSDFNVSALLNGSIAIYKCISGYTLLTGSLSRVCGGTPLAWAGYRPECVVLCSNPGTGSGTSYVMANNDPVSSALVLGTTVTYSCDAGLEHSVGDMVRVCHGTGTWTGDAPTCIARQPYQKVRMTYTCLPGYRHVSGDALLVCVRDNSLQVTTWDGNAAECQVLCSNPGTGSGTSYVMANNDPVRGALVLGTTVTYSCDAGLEHSVGDMVRVCHGTGTWPGDAPTCIAITHYCSYPPVGINVILSAATLSEGSNVTYTCLPGYRHVSGDASLVCVRDNSLQVTSWDGNAAECQASCGLPDVVANTSYVMSSAKSFVGTVVTYSCASGFELVAGDLVRVCYGVDLWTGDAPNCTAVNASSEAVVPIRTAAAEEIAKELVTNYQPDDSSKINCQVPAVTY